MIISDIPEDEGSDRSRQIPAGTDGLTFKPPPGDTANCAFTSSLFFFSSILYVTMWVPFFSPLFFFFWKQNALNAFQDEAGLDFPLQNQVLLSESAALSSPFFLHTHLLSRGFSKTGTFGIPLLVPSSHVRSHICLVCGRCRSRLNTNPCLVLKSSCPQINRVQGGTGDGLPLHFLPSDCLPQVHPSTFTFFFCACWGQ